MTVPLSALSHAFKFVWLKYKIDKAIKKREPYIKALLKTTEGRAIQRAILESPNSDVVYIDIEENDWGYLDEFADERLLEVTVRGNVNGGSMFAFRLTHLGKKYFSK
jgi:vacuolar-type H+-ATPase subunit E/Vma4